MPLSSRILNLSTEEALKEVLTLCREGSPVKMLVSQEKGLGLEMESVVDYGQNLPASFAKLDPDASWWRTSQACLYTQELELFLENWPSWGLMLNGECYQPQKLAPRISEIESGLLATPAAADGVGSHGRGQSKSLRKELLPTPCRPNNGGTHGKAKLKRMLPTVRAVAARDSIKDRNKSNLGEVIGGVTGLKLSPSFVEWMMGWPIGWTRLDSAATAWFRNNRCRHGKKS